MNRLVDFLRSVLPTDPWQLVFLSGVVCLTLCSGLTWLPDSGTIPDVREIFKPQLDWGGALYPILVFAIYPIVFAGLAGYFACFWPGPRPARRILLTVITPTLVSLAAIFVKLAMKGPVYSSILQSSSSIETSRLQTMVFFLKYSVGLHYCLLGIGLVFLFAIRLSFGKSQLSLVLPELRTYEEDHLWRRAKVLIYLMIGPMFIVEIIAALPTMIAHMAGFNVFFSTVWILFWELAGTFLILCLALWLMTATKRQMVVDKLRLPNRNFFLLALGSAIAVAFAIPVSIYLHDRIHWAAFDFGRLSPPNFFEYFSRPPVAVIGLIAAAILEEVIFRGFLQAKLIQRYGVLRGIFVTGAAWAAIHFRSDTYPDSDLWAFVHVILRVAMCLALSFVFGWLTLKSGSILPAMLTHATINFFAYNAVTAVTFELLPGVSQSAIKIVLWAILAFVLFRFWPPSVEPETLPHLEQGEAAPVSGETGQMPGQLTP